MPAYSHHAATTTGPGQSIDIIVPCAPGYPPVMTCTGTGVTFNIENSADNVSWNIVGTFVAPQQKDLIPCVPFWRTNVTINGAATAFTSAVGPVLGPDGHYSQPGVVATGYSAGL